MSGLDQIPGAIFERTDMLRPGTDWHGDILYMTFPIDRMEQQPIKGGKKGDVEDVRVTRTIVVTNTRRAFWYERKIVAEEGFRFPPQGFNQSFETRWPEEEIKSYIEGDTKKISKEQLLNDLRQIYLDYVEYTDQTFYSLLPYYILGSYVYRIFPTLGYLHFNGTKASGKSQNLKLLRTLGFNCIWASNLSTASLYRHVDGCPGLICIDEAESFEGEKGEELRRLLNAGYKDGEPVLRAEAQGDGTFAVRQYDLYSPKALASINPLEPVVQSRCIVVPMQPASLKDIREFREDDPKWAALRNRIYRWAMDHASDVAQLYDEWNQELRFEHAKILTNRTWEITQMFIVMAHHLEGIDSAKALVRFFAEYFHEQQKAEEEVDKLKLLLKCLPQVLLLKDAATNGEYLLKDIHDVVVEYIDEDLREYYRTKQVSRHLTALGFRGRGKVKGGTTVPIDEQEVRNQMKKRSVTPFPDNEAWLQGKASYHRSSGASASATLWGPDEPATTTQPS
jgi:hypothetical protein